MPPMEARQFRDRSVAVGALISGRLAEPVRGRLCAGRPVEVPAGPRITLTAARARELMRPRHTGVVRSRTSTTTSLWRRNGGMNGALNRASRTAPTGCQGASARALNNCRPRLSEIARVAPA